MVKLFIDNIRKPKTSGWKIVRSYKTAINFFKKHECPSIISIDHDLGGDKTGYDIVKWLCEYDMDTNYLDDVMIVKIHSANPVGKQNIRSYLENYSRFSGKKILISEV